LVSVLFDKEPFFWCARHGC